jgi:hypothetical protein
MIVFAHASAVRRQTQHDAVRLHGVRIVSKEESCNYATRRIFFEARGLCVTWT